MLVVIWTFIGIANGEMTLWSMLSSSRAWLYILVLMMAFKRDCKVINPILLHNVKLIKYRGCIFTAN